MMKETISLTKILLVLLLLVWVVFSLFPILWMLLISFKSDADIYRTLFVFSPTLENYREVLIGTDYVRAFIDNIVVSAGAVLLSMAVGMPAAYALARYTFKGKDSLAFTMLSFRFAPEILVIVPLFLIYQKIGLYDTHLGLIWVYQLITLPLLIWVLRGYFEDISVDLEHAAQIDGYKRHQIFFKILLPLIRPGLVASALLAFIFAWNSFTFGLLLSGYSVETITVSSLKYLASDTVHYGQMAAASLIAVVPEIVLAIFIQKHLVRGLSFGAVKG